MHPNARCALCRGDKETSGGFFVCICTTPCGSAECQHVAAAKEDAPAVTPSVADAPALTTAQRLSAYYDELKAAGFNTETASELTLRAAPTNLTDVEIQADLDEGLPALSVRVNLVPHLDPEEIRRLGEEVAWMSKVRRPAGPPEGGVTADV